MLWHDEFMRLSYQGLRAKDKSFNAEMVTQFDKTIPEINIVQPYWPGVA